MAGGGLINSGDEGRSLPLCSYEGSVMKVNAVDLIICVTEVVPLNIRD